MEHLIDSVKEIALMNDASRIEFINKNRWIKYPHAEKIIDRLEELLVYPKISRMPNMLIVGETNNGKTILVNRFFNLHQPFVDEKTEKLNIPVLYIQAPPVPDEKRFYHKILDALNAPYRYNDKIEQKERQARNILEHVNTKMIIIDEIHNILAGNLSKQRAFLNVIKYLANELQIVIVAVGIKEALNAINTDPQISNRFIPEYLPKWNYSEEYLRLLMSFERLIPLKKQSLLVNDQVSKKILELSEGTIGEISNVISKAAIDAIISKKEKIDIEILKNLNYIKPSDRRRQTNKYI